MPQVDSVGHIGGYGIRIYSRRPVAWSRKEGGILAYSYHAATVEWYRRRQALAKLRRMTGETKSTELVRLMAEWKVRYVVLGAAEPMFAPGDLPGRIRYSETRSEP